MSKFQIEKVEHSSVYKTHNCCVVDYYSNSDKLIQLNFTDPVFAKEMRLIISVGIWRIKSLKNN